MQEESLVHIRIFTWSCVQSHIERCDAVEKSDSTLADESSITPGVGGCCLSLDVMFWQHFSQEGSIRIK